MSVLNDVEAERRRQIEKWGTEKDLNWTPMDWHEMIADYNAWARRMATMQSYDKYRRRLIQVAALAVAAVEALDKALENA